VRRRGMTARRGMVRTLSTASLIVSTAFLSRNQAVEHEATEKTEVELGTRWNASLPFARVLIAAEVTRRTVARTSQEIRLVTSAATRPGDFSDAALVKNGKLGTMSVIREMEGP